MPPNTMFLYNPGEVDHIDHSVTERRVDDTSTEITITARVYYKRKPSGVVVYGVPVVDDPNNYLPDGTGQIGLRSGWKPDESAE